MLGLELKQLRQQIVKAFGQEDGTEEDAERLLRNAKEKLRYHMRATAVHKENKKRSPIGAVGKRLMFAYMHDQHDPRAA